MSLVITDWRRFLQQLDLARRERMVALEKQLPEYLRAEYLHTALHIGGSDDNGEYLLIPRVVTDGEWEAWHLAYFLPGASRFRSFADLMSDQLTALRRM